MNTTILSLAIGGAVTLVTLLAPYDYCRNGRARGFPLAAVIPACEATPVSFGLGHLEGVQVMDVPRALGDVALWSGLAFGAVGLVERRRERPGESPFGCSDSRCGL